MKALELIAPKTFEYKDIPRPEIGPDEVLIRVRACGICGSDVHGMDGSSGRRIPPIVMGHEAAGIIEAVGSAVDAGRWKPGDRVTCDSTVYCGRCWHCARGEINLCDERMVLGVSCGDYRRYGAFAEYVAVPERILYRMPDGLTFEQAAMVEAVSVAVHAVGRVQVRMGDMAVVVGAGMIGLLCLQALRAAGCAKVLVADLDERRLELARELGAAACVNPASGNAAELARQLTNGRGADIAIEAVGVSASLNTAINALRKGGACVLIGNLAKSADLPLQQVVTREIALFGACASAGEYPACMELIASGAINVDKLISRVSPLAEGAEWFDRLYRGEPGLTKVILAP